MPELGSARYSATHQLTSACAWPFRDVFIDMPPTYHTSAHVAPYQT
jgi:hypothetical protein